jgi:20S proteasome alpha/beta subunit
MGRNPSKGADGNKEKDRKEVMTFILKTLYGRNLLITITDQVLFNWLKENFKYYYANTIPIGYGTGNQYHLLLKNNGDSREPIIEKEIVKEVVKEPVKTDEILNIINEAFKKTINRDKRLSIIKEELNTLNH